MILFFLLFFIFCPNVYSQQSELPFELKLLVLGLKEYDLSEAQNKEVSKLIHSIESNTQEINKSLLNVMIKTEIAQNLILYFQALPHENKPLEITSSTIPLINKKLFSGLNQYYSFSRYVIESISSDLWNVSKDQKENSLINKNRKIKSMLSPIVEDILINSPVEFNELLLPFMLKTIKKIGLEIALFQKLSRFQMTKGSSKKELTTLFDKTFDTSDDTKIEKFLSDDYRRIKAESLMEKIEVIDSTDNIIKVNNDYWIPSDSPSLQVNSTMNSEDVSSSEKSKEKYLEEWKPWSN